MSWLGWVRLVWACFYSSPAMPCVRDKRREILTHLHCNVLVHASFQILFHCDIAVQKEKRPTLALSRTHDLLICVREWTSVPQPLSPFFQVWQRHRLQRNSFQPWTWVEWTEKICFEKFKVRCSGWLAPVSVALTPNPGWSLKRTMLSKCITFLWLASIYRSSIRASHPEAPGSNPGSTA